MSNRLFATLDRSRIRRSTIHFEGMPPSITEQHEARKPLPYPKVVVLVETESGVSLVRYTEDGTNVGDTWHLNIEDAKHQANFEYGDALSEWKPIPVETSDVVGYALLHPNKRVDAQH